MSGARVDGRVWARPDDGARAMTEVERALDEGRFADAVALLEDGLRIFIGWQLPRLLDSLNRLPPSLVESSARLSMARWSAVSFFSQDHPQAMIEAARRFGSRGSPNEVLDRVFAGLGEILALRSVRDLRGGLLIADRDRALVDSRRIEWLEIEGEVRALAAFQWGVSRMLAQDVRGAVRELQESYWAGARTTMPHFARSAAELASLLLAVCDSTAGAREWLDKARGLPPVPAHLRSFMEDFAPLTEAALALGRLELEAAGEALERFHASPDAQLAWSVDLWLRARLFLLRGRSDAALDLVDHVIPPRGGAPDPGSFDEALVRGAEAELALAVGRVARAEVLLELAPSGPFVHPARARFALTRGDLEEAVILSVAGMQHEVPFGRVDLKVIGAAAYLRLGRAAEAAELFGHALELSRMLDVIAPFALLPRAELEGLVELVPRARVELERVLSSLPVNGSKKVPVIELSEREKRVLAELSTTPSAREIAVRLFVSQNTVKSQLRSIYRKLGVHSREAALEVALELGFDLGRGRS